MSEHLTAFVYMIRYEAQDVVSVELRPVRGETFPAFTAGAHIDLHLPNGIDRSYSLCNSSDERGRYVVAVLRDRASRGGSRFVHDQLRVGTVINVSSPVNNFPLVEEADRSILIAGGIGVTPLLCMAKKLKSVGKPFEFLLLAASARKAAFVDELRGLGAPLHLHFDDEEGGLPDLRGLISDRMKGGQPHFYACGPSAMLDAFVDVVSELKVANSHIERFSAQRIAPSQEAEQGYVVKLARSDRTLNVAPGTSLLDALIEAGVGINYSCCEGVCGSCRTAILGGEADHRDSILTPKERVANSVMFPCVSGCKGHLLTLDL